MDAFSCPWSQEQFYALPPFNLILRCLKKIEMEKGEGIIIAPVWPTQLWYPKLTSPLFDTPRLLPVTRGTVYLPSKPSQPQLAHGGLTEANCMQVIGDSLTKQGISAEATKIILKSWRRGTSKQYQSYYKNGLTSLIENRLVQFIPL